MSGSDIIIADLRRKIDCGTHDEDGCGSCSRCLACVKNAHDSLLDRVKFTLRQLGKAQAEAQHLRNQTENDTAKIYDLRRQLDRMREERDEALSGEADAVRRAEAAELGCEIAYRREPTQAEGDAHEYAHHESMGPSHGTGECFVPMGGWTGRRCRVCRRWAWGGQTVCEACAAFESGKERAVSAEAERDEARAELVALRRHFDAAAPEHNLPALLDAYEEDRTTALRERDEARAELAECRSGKDALRDARDTCRRLREAAEKHAKDMESERDEARKAECYARAELARLRARMPSGAELEAFRYVPKCIQPNLISVNGVSARAIKKHIRAWLARQEGSDG